MSMKNSSCVYVTSTYIISTGKQTITNHVLLVSVIASSSSNDNTNISLLGNIIWVMFVGQ